MFYQLIDECNRANELASSSLFGDEALFGLGDEDIEPQLRKAFFSDTTDSSSHSKRDSDCHFLLEQIFLDSKAPEHTQPDTGSKLSTYIDLIVDRTRPNIDDQQNYYFSLFNQIKAGATLRSILERPEFRIKEDEKKHEYLFRSIANKIRDLRAEYAEEVINFWIDNASAYSLVRPTTINIGVRYNISYWLARALNESGWRGEDGLSVNNSDENLRQIVGWIFGDAEKHETGVLHRLYYGPGNVSGLYDLMHFRLMCCPNRGNDLFNMMRALALDATPPGPTDGSLNLISVSAMRRITQEAFKIFKTEFIAKEVNLFEEIDKLEAKHLTGTWGAQFGDEFPFSGEINTAIEETKNIMKTFVLYQLTSKSISMGVGCGRYDEQGYEDKSGIYEVMNTYIFEILFSRTHMQRQGERHFIEFALMQLEGRSEDYSDQVLQKMTVVLDKKRLMEYWEVNRSEILEYVDRNSRRQVKLPGRALFYSDFEILIKRALDFEMDQQSH